MHIDRSVPGAEPIVAEIMLVVGRAVSVESKDPSVSGVARPAPEIAGGGIGTI